MKISYRNPWSDQINQQWEAFQEQTLKLSHLLIQYGFTRETSKYFKIPKSNYWKFSAFFKSEDRTIKISYSSRLQKEGAVSFSIYPNGSKSEPQGINLYQYLKKNFTPVSRKSLFLSRYKGTFSQKLYRVFKNYVTFGEFYMHSILSGKYWDDSKK
jgi:hypothetical protein